MLEDQSNRKLVCGIVVIAALGLPFVSAETVHASCTDAEFSFSWNDFSGTQCTPIRQKDNNSSMYIYAKNVDRGRTFTAYATAYVDGRYIDVSRGHSVVLGQGDVGLLVNWVNESGYSQASIAATKDGPFGMSAFGVWSPDYCK